MLGIKGTGKTNFVLRKCFGFCEHDKRAGFGLNSICQLPEFAYIVAVEFLTGLRFAEQKLNRRLVEAGSTCDNRQEVETHIFRSY